MLIQVLIRLMLYIDQVIVRKDDTGIHSGIKHEMSGIDNTVSVVVVILLSFFWSLGHGCVPGLVPAMLFVAIVEHFQGK